MKIKNYIKIAEHGPGFVKWKDTEIRIQKDNLNNAIQKDYVLVGNIKKYNNILEGSVIKIIKRTLKQLTGIILNKNKNKYTIYFFELYTKINCILNKELILNDIITVQIIGSNLNIHKNKFKFINKISSFNNPNSDSLFIKKMYNLPTEFPDKVIKNLKHINKITTDSEHIDFTHLNCITIDPETSKDFDDALSLNIVNDTYILGVHIADVSYFVKEGSPIDLEARKRCNSVYLLDEVIPMLPFKLADDICSLVPNKKRYTVSIFMTIKNGKVLNYKIKRAIIINKRRFTYSEAKNILDTKKGEWYKLLNNLKVLALQIKKNKIDSGLIDFRNDDLKLRLDSKGFLIKTEFEEYDITHQMIETFMVLANETVAYMLSKKYKLVPYRTHPKMNQEKRMKFLNFLNDIYNKRYHDFNALFNKIKNTKLESLVITKYIKSGGSAEYTTKNIGHASLNSKYYTHFTSPIRRYIDLIVHRMITDDYSLDEHTLNNILIACNESTQTSKNIERFETKIKFNRHFKMNKTVYTGLVQSITKNKLFIYLPDFDQEIQINFDTLGRSIEFTKFNRCFIGKNKYCIGDSIKIYPQHINIFGDNLWIIK
jgi:ribonuclease R